MNQFGHDFSGQQIQQQQQQHQQQLQPISDPNQASQFQNSNVNTVNQHQGPQNPTGFPGQNSQVSGQGTRGTPTSTPRPTSTKNSKPGEEVNPKLEEFKVTSRIQLRYAHTTVETYVKNPSSEAQVRSLDPKILFEIRFSNSFKLFV